MYFATTSVAGTATSTLSALTILGSSGNVGIGTAEPGTKLHVVGGVYLNTTQSDTPLNGSLSANGIFGSGGYWGIRTAVNASFNLDMYNGGSPVTAITALQGGNVGIGTTTPQYLLTIASSTTSQLSLSAGAGIAQWAFRNAGGNLYFATTSVAGTATSTLSALTILGSSGYVGIATSTNLNAMLTLQGVGSADILRIATSTSNSDVITISKWGGFTQKISSSTALSIQMASGTPVFEVDTTQSNTNAGIDITAGTGQTANLLNMYSSGGTFLSGFTAAGGLFMNISSSTAINMYDGSASAAFVVNSTGKSVGIGTSTLTYNLNVSGSQSSTYIARVNNAATDNTADGLLISLGVANASRGTGNYFIGFANGSQTVAGKIQGGANAVAYTTTSADIAEFFRISNLDDVPEAGEIVVLDKAKEKSVIRAEPPSPSQGEPLGIISTNPGFIGNGPICLAEDIDCDTEYAKYNVLVSLAGQVPVKISLENGPIEVGDYLTLSDTIPGAAAKMVENGYTVGTAVSLATTTSIINASSTETFVMVLIKSGWREVNAGSLVTNENGVEIPGIWSSLFNFFKKLGLEIGSNFIKIANLVTDKITSQKVETKELCIDDVCVNKDQLAALLANAGIISSTTPPVTDDETSTTTSPIIDDTATTTPLVIEEEPTASTTPPVVETPTEPTPEPEPEPEPVVEPTPTPEPTEEPAPAEESVPAEEPAPVVTADSSPADSEQTTQ